MVPSGIGGSRCSKHVFRTLYLSIFFSGWTSFWGGLQCEQVSAERESLFPKSSDTSPRVPMGPAWVPCPSLNQSLWSGVTWLPFGLHSSPHPLLPPNRGRQPYPMMWSEIEGEVVALEKRKEREKKCWAGTNSTFQSGL